MLLLAQLLAVVIDVARDEGQGGGHWEASKVGVGEFRAGLETERSLHFGDGGSTAIPQSLYGFGLRGRGVGGTGLTRCPCPRKRLTPQDSRQYGVAENESDPGIQPVLHRRTSGEFSEQRVIRQIQMLHDLRRSPLALPQRPDP